MKNYLLVTLIGLIAAQAQCMELDSIATISLNPESTSRCNLDMSRILCTLPDKINSVAYSHDGKTILTGSKDKKAYLWDISTGNNLMEFKEHTGSVESVAYSPDSKTVLTGSMDYTARLWDVKTRQQLHIFQGHTHGILSVAFSPDGKTVLTGSYDETARLWDRETGKQLQQFNHTSSVNSVAYSPDGKTVLTGAGHKVRLWNAKTAEQLLFQGSTHGINSVAYSPDGKTILTGSHDNTARLWSVKTGQLHILHILQHGSSVMSVAYSLDGKTVLTGSLDKTACLWDVTTGDLLKEFKGHTDAIESVAYSPDGNTILTGSLDGTARIWSCSRSSPNEKLQSNEETNVEIKSTNKSTIKSCVICKKEKRTEGKNLLRCSRCKNSWYCSTECQKKDWPSHKMTCKPHLEKTLSYNYVPFKEITEYGPRGILSPDGKTILTYSGNSAYVWDIETEKVLELKGHQKFISEAVFSPDGKTILTGAWDGEARLWKVSTGEQLQLIRAHISYVTSVAFSPDGKTVLTGSGGKYTGADNIVRLWNASAGKLLREFRGHTDTVISVAFSPDGKIVFSGAWDHTARLWSPKTGLPLHTLEYTGSNVTIPLAFSPDSRVLFIESPDKKTAYLWDIVTREVSHMLIGHSARIKSSVVFSPDGKTILTGYYDNTACLWDAETSKLLHKLIGHTDEINVVAFSPDGKTVLTGSGTYKTSHDNTARLWDATTGKLLKTLSGHKEFINSVAFSPDGEIILTSSTDKIILWKCMESI